MGYYIDLSQISLEEFRSKLKTAYLPPSRRILLNDIENQFQILKNEGIENVDELRIALKTKKKVEEFSTISEISFDYLTILIREINSSLPKPNKINDFPDISPEAVEKLGQIGIKHTVQLYERVRTSTKRKELAAETGISNEIIIRLTKLTDLSRVRWVNHTFAYMLCEIGFNTVKKLADADAVVLHKSIVDINNKRKFFKGNVGLNDIRICINAAKEVPPDIEY